MSRVVVIALSAALASVVTLEAQNTPLTQATPAPDAPSLLGNVSVSDGDSALVRAAKLTFAARRREASRSTGVVINDAYMKQHPGGRISEATNLVPLPALPPEPSKTGPHEVARPNIATVDRAAVERENARLRDEQARAGAEMDEPYGGNNTGMEEDRAAQRSTQIPQQILKNDQQVRPHP